MGMVPSREFVNSSSRVTSTRSAAQLIRVHSQYDELESHPDLSDQLVPSVALYKLISTDRIVSDRLARRSTAEVCDAALSEALERAAPNSHRRIHELVSKRSMPRCAQRLHIILIELKRCINLNNQDQLATK